MKVALGVEGSYIAFNRTNVELKQRWKIIVMIVPMSLLIAPMWN